jgi:vitamin B12 transporter
MTRATDDAGMPSPTFAQGQRLTRRPAHSAELATRARVLDRVTLGGSVTYVGRRDDVDFNQSPSQRIELDGYTLVDLTGEAELLRPREGRPGVGAVLRVENLFDERYEQVVGFSGRRRGVFGGARFRF